MNLLNKIFKKGVVAGTFSKLHKGHKFLLKHALEKCHTLIICITTDDFAKRLNKNHPVEEYNVRKKYVLEYISTLGENNRVIIEPLTDIYGPAITDPSIEVLFVSEETFIRGLKVLKERIRRGLPPFYLWVIPILLAENGKPISSTRIWKGEINKEGRIIRLK